jgi:hypothetical protein
MMNREDVIRLMLEADPEMIINIKGHEEGMEGFTGEDPKLLQFWPFKNYMKFAALVAAAEREACAETCDETRFTGYCPPEYGIARDYYDAAAEHCAAAIRARGEA